MALKSNALDVAVRKQFEEERKQIVEAKVRTKKRKPLSSKDVSVGEKLTIPEGYELGDVIEVLERCRDEQDGKIQIIEMIDAFPLDAARALRIALEDMFPSFYREGKKIQTFMGEIDVPPVMRTIETGHNQTELIHWGRFCVPGSDGNIETKFGLKNNRQVLSIVADVKQKEEDMIREIAERTREILRNRSVYKGKAFKVSFERIMQDDVEINVCIPSFFDISLADTTELIYNDNIQQSIDMNLFTVLRETQKCRAHKIPLKRGVLLYGKYGVGKTMAALHTAKIAQDNGWTFIYIKNPYDIPSAIGFAQQYQPAVIFCEDIDKALSGTRGLTMDGILNSIDGVDSKSTEIVTVMTTNFVDKIDRAMLRPGRIDCAIEVSPPDAYTALKIIRQYGRGYLKEDCDYSQVSAMFDGQIPAVIGEAVEKAKLYAISHSKEEVQITPNMIEIAFMTMASQRSLLEDAQNTDEYISDNEKATKLMMEGVRKILKDFFGK